MQASSQKGCSRKYVGHDKLSVVLLAHARQLLEKTDCCPQLFITVIAPGRHAGHFDAVLKDPEEFGGSVDRRRCSKVRRWRVNEIDEIRCIFPASREGRAGLRRPYRSSPDSPLEEAGFEPSVPLVRPVSERQSFVRKVSRDACASRNARRSRYPDNRLVRWGPPSCPSALSRRRPRTLLLRSRLYDQRFSC